MGGCGTSCQILQWRGPPFLGLWCPCSGQKWFDGDLGPWKNRCRLPLPLLGGYTLPGLSTFPSTRERLNKHPRVLLSLAFGNIPKLKIPLLCALFVPFTIALYSNVPQAVPT